jgi:hypothetical protein
MERIQIYKRQKGYELYVKIFGLLFFAYGMTFLIKSLINGFKTELFDGDWRYVSDLIFGIILFIFGYPDRKQKYFIQWDDKEMKYLLSKDKTAVTIAFADIKKITLQLYEIKIELASTEKILSLENVQYKELRKIKEKFEELKLITDKRKE